MESLTIEEFEKLTKAEVERIASEPGWIFKDGKLEKVSPEEYAKIKANFKPGSPAYLDYFGD